MWGLLAALSCAPKVLTPPAASGEVVILAINDTYRIEGDRESNRGGLGRVAALRRSLGQPDALVLHAGDLLGPSFLSRTFAGQQMIDVMNLLDGDDAAFDPYLFVTLGNHEIDEVKSAAVLDAVVESSQFTWLIANLQTTPLPDGSPSVAAANYVPRRIVESGGVKVGIFGLLLDKERPAWVAGYGDPIAVAREQTAALRAEGAALVIGLTHQDMEADQALLAALGAEGPDVLFGGHEHEQQSAVVGGRAVFKANADATSATLVRIRPVAGQPPQIVAESFLPLEGASPAPDPVVEARVQTWLDAHAAAFCWTSLDAKGKALRQPPACLDAVVGTSAVLLKAEELEIRRFETNLGNLMADYALSAGQAKGATVAFLNSGSLRLNRDVPAGPIPRRVIEELFAYPTPLVTMELTGAQLQAVAARAVEGWTGQGHFLQVAGFAFAFDPARGDVSRLTALDPGGSRPLAPQDRVTVVTTDYLAKGNDGYGFLAGIPATDLGVDLKALSLERLGASPPAAPAVVGRICNAQRPGPCLALPSP